MRGGEGVIESMDEGCAIFTLDLKPSKFNISHKNPFQKSILQNFILVISAGNTGQMNVFQANFSICSQKVNNNCFNPSAQRLMVKTT